MFLPHFSLRTRRELEAWRLGAGFKGPKTKSSWFMVTANLPAGKGSKILALVLAPQIQFWRHFSQATVRLHASYICTTHRYALPACGTCCCQVFSRNCWETTLPPYSPWVFLSHFNPMPLSWTSFKKLRWYAIMSCTNVPGVTRYTKFPGSSPFHSCTAGITVIWVMLCARDFKKYYSFRGVMPSDLRE